LEFYRRRFESTFICLVRKHGVVESAVGREILTLDSTCAYHDIVLPAKAVSEELIVELIVCGWPAIFLLARIIVLRGVRLEVAIKDAKFFVFEMVANQPHTVAFVVPLSDVWSVVE